MLTVISHDNDDTIENADGRVVGLTGPRLGCIDCNEDVDTLWRGVTLHVWGVECVECGEMLAEEAS